MTRGNVVCTAPHLGLPSDGVDGRMLVILREEPWPLEESCAVFTLCVLVARRLAVWVDGNEGVCREQSDSLPRGEHDILCWVTTAMGVTSLLGIVMTLALWFAANKGACLYAARRRACTAPRDYHHFQQAQMKFHSCMHEYRIH